MRNGKEHRKILCRRISDVPVLNTAMALNKLIDARAYQMEDMKATLRLRVDNEQLQQHQQQQQI